VTLGETVINPSLTAAGPAVLTGCLMTLFVLLVGLAASGTGVVARIPYGVAVLVPVPPVVTVRSAENPPHVPSGNRALSRTRWLTPASRPA
jgi:hypothetical protein